MKLVPLVYVTDMERALEAEAPLVHFDLGSNLAAHAVSGICSSSPLHVRELREFTEVPVFNSAEPDMADLRRILLARAKRAERSVAG